MGRTYEIPEAPPSGAAGSLYRIRLKVTNQRSLFTEVYSPPFYIVESNPALVRTLILARGPGGELATRLQELASHPRVQGLVVDLSRIEALGGLYTDWDNHALDSPQSNARTANALLFGRDGIHDQIGKLLKIHTGVKYLVLVGDDRVIPFARIADRTGLLDERSYAQGLGFHGSTVTLALQANQILSDDPLAFSGPVELEDLAGTGETRVFLPDLAAGRLVETPEEIIKTISTFIGNDGILDLARLNGPAKHKVLVTGYDYLLDSGNAIYQSWRKAFGLHDGADDSGELVDGGLLTQWDGLGNRLCGNGGEPYGISFLNGQTTHNVEGEPGKGVTGTTGLPASEILGDLCKGSPLNLNGGVVFSTGGHGGLPVPGSSGADLDLPQTFLARGALVYVANTGYGWGLQYGIGYEERLQQILSEEMARDGVIVTGEAVRRTKRGYFQEAALFDAYDEKSLLQWTFFGLPMYAVKTGASGSPAAQAAAGSAATKAEYPVTEQIGSVTVERRKFETSPESAKHLANAEVQEALPPFLARLDLHFDFSAKGAYTKRGASGQELDLANPGCPDTEENGCYYTLNGLGSRATGARNQLIQPYFVHDSRLAGTSQHGILWTGGTFVQESGWKPVVARLASNRDPSDVPDILPAQEPSSPRRRKRIARDLTGCPIDDSAPERLIVLTGEALGKSSSIERRFTQLDHEVFYFTSDSDLNCDIFGPRITLAHHEVEGNRVKWDVKVEDSDVWRVVAVYNDLDENTIDGGEWVALELAKAGGDEWTGTADFKRPPHLEYVLQAVDTVGNVSWLDVMAVAPESGAASEIPLVRMGGEEP